MKLKWYYGVIVLAFVVYVIFAVKTKSAMNEIQASKDYERQRLINLASIAEKEHYISFISRMPIVVLLMQVLQTHSILLSKAGSSAKEILV